MKIRLKSIEHNIFGDAPFIATRLSGISCERGCVGCQHEHLKGDGGIQEVEAQDIIDSVLANPFDQGIVFGGLEWTEQPTELRELIELAQDNGLYVMVYTHLGPEEFIKRMGRLSGILVKHGPYVAGGESHVDMGVRLPNKEQYILQH